jgi:superfamily II DNA/RNA helicase
LFLKGLVGGGAAAVSSFSGLFHNPVFAAETRKAQKRCILLWLCGAPSQFETWDPKPGRPSGGPFGSIPTRIPGVHFSSLMPRCASIADRLNIAGFAAAALHGDMHQGARNRTLDALRRGQLRVLVATDVAARGIDVPGITHVFNYDLPKFAEDYVHRIGRTGRAGRNGMAISLVNHAEGVHVSELDVGLARSARPLTNP